MHRTVFESQLSYVDTNTEGLLHFLLMTQALSHVVQVEPKTFLEVSKLASISTSFYYLTRVLSVLCLERNLVLQTFSLNFKFSSFSEHVSELPTIFLAANVFGVSYKTSDSLMELAQRLRITRSLQILSDK